MLYAQGSQFSFVIYFIHSIDSVYMSIPISQFILLPHLPLSYVCSLPLSLGELDFEGPCREWEPLKAPEGIHMVKSPFGEIQLQSNIIKIAEKN